MVSSTEPCLKGNGEQEPSEDLRARLGDPQLLQDLVPIPIHPLVQGLVATVRRVDVGVGLRGPIVRSQFVSLHVSLSSQS